MLADMQTVLESAGLMLTGMLIVLSALTLLALLIEVLSRYLRDPVPASSGESTVAAPLPTPTLAAAPTADDDELLAVIAAAASLAVGRAVRVRTVQALTQAGDDMWTTAGRARVMGSHRLPRPR